MGLDNPLHIAFLVVILLLVFGARRLPEIGRSLGSGMREFKDSISGEASSHAKSPPQPAITQAPPQPVQASQQQASQQQASQQQASQQQASQQQASQQQAAEAFGATPPEQTVPAEPTRQS